MTDKKSNIKPNAAERVFELFDQGRRFTEELLKENEKLRLANAKLKAEMADVQKQYVRVDVPRLQQKVQLLEEELRAHRQENESLKGSFATIEEENREFADRYVKVERQNCDLVNLYVASYRLHSTLQYTEVIEIIKEIVINMVGSETFGVYVYDEDQKCLVLIAHEGMEETSIEAVPLDQGVLGQTATTGELYTAPEGTEMDQAGDEPVACIPLKVGDRQLGVIGIFRLLLQKDGFLPVDFELFELLGGHAATALYVSKLYGISERKRNTLEGFIDLLRSGQD